MKIAPWAVNSFFPRYPNPWPNGVCVEWVWGRGWVPCFDVDMTELLNDFHRSAPR